jgi:hypothetical protein
MSTAPSRVSRPLPARIEVSTQALAQIVNALNGHPHQIRELQVTRGPLFSNPIDVIERELLTAQAAPEPARPVSEEDIQGELFNHKRVGGPSASEVIDVVRKHFSWYSGSSLVRERCEEEITKLFEGK